MCARCALHSGQEDLGARAAIGLTFEEQLPSIGLAARSARRRATGQPEEASSEGPASERSRRGVTAYRGMRRRLSVGT